MIVFKNKHRFSRYQQNCVATIGKFDGVHLGHQLILDQLKRKAEQFEQPSLVILIEPHPEEFFAGEDGDCPARLSSRQEKLELLESFDIDFVYQLTFDRAMSERSPEAWVKEILVDGLGVVSLVIGNDFRFGHKRRGDFALLRAQGREYDFEVCETTAYERNGQRISSSFIRETLAAGDFELAGQLLGRPWSIKGTVVKGRQSGTELGFPTCNLNPRRRRIPLHGVYAGEVRLGDRLHPAAVNVGYRPTLTNAAEAVLEAHILDFAGDLYGRDIEIVFRRKIRDEMKFDGIESLKRQIGIDVGRVREIFQELKELQEAKESKTAKGRAA